MYTPLGQADLALSNERGAHDSMLAILRARVSIALYSGQEMSTIQKLFRISSIPTRTKGWEPP